MQRLIGVNPKPIMPGRRGQSMTARVDRARTGHGVADLPHQRGLAPAGLEPVEDPLVAHQLPYGAVAAGLEHGLLGGVGWLFVCLFGWLVVWLFVCLFVCLLVGGFGWQL